MRKSREHKAADFKSKKEAASTRKESRRTVVAKAEDTDQVNFATRFEIAADNFKSFCQANRTTGKQALMRERQIASRANDGKQHYGIELDNFRKACMDSSLDTKAVRLGLAWEHAVSSCVKAGPTQQAIDEVYQAVENLTSFLQDRYDADHEHDDQF